MIRRNRPHNEGQALVEMLVVMPVLLLLLLGAAEMGKLFVVSGKTEIAARYVALSHFREAPFGDAYPAHTAQQEIRDLFFKDALDDSGPTDDGTDVIYQELVDDDLDYAPLFDDEILRTLWDEYLDLTSPLIPIRGARCTFTYDVPFFPFGRENPMEETRPLEETPSGGLLAGSYDASGNFVMIADSFSGERGEVVRLMLEAAGLTVGVVAGLPLDVLLGLALWVVFLP